jgi:hypothetical protein
MPRRVGHIGSIAVDTIDWEILDNLFECHVGVAMPEQG